MGSFGAGSFSKREEFEVSESSSQRLGIVAVCGYPGIEHRADGCIKASSGICYEKRSRL